MNFAWYKRHPVSKSFASVGRRNVVSYGRHLLSGFWASFPRRGGVHAILLQLREVART